jgi:hypothetical protein
VKRAARPAILLAALLLGACPAPDPNKGLGTTPPPDQLLDYNQFVCAVQPVLIRRCSFLACHGNPDHALRIYSPGKLRIDDSGKRNDRDAVLNKDEVELNFQSASGLVLSASADARAAPDLQQVLLLGKPVARRAGGAEHHGVGVFPVYPAHDLSDDPEFLALANWVGGAKQPTAVDPATQQVKVTDPACAQMFMILGLSPRAM